MKAVRHLPVAEQYPSSTSIVSFFASKRISGISRHSLSRIEFMDNRFHFYSHGNRFVFCAASNPCANSVLFYVGDPFFIVFIEIHANKTGCIVFPWPTVLTVLRLIALPKICDTVISAVTVYMVNLFFRKLAIYIEPCKPMSQIAPSIYCYECILNATLIFSTVSAQLSGLCLHSSVNTINKHTSHRVVRDESNERLMRNQPHKFTIKKMPRMPKHLRGETRLSVREEGDTVSTWQP